MFTLVLCFLLYISLGLVLQTKPLLQYYEDGKFDHLGLGPNIIAVGALIVTLFWPIFQIKHTSDLIRNTFRKDRS